MPVVFPSRPAVGWARGLRATTNGLFGAFEASKSNHASGAKLLQHQRKCHWHLQRNGQLRNAENPP